MSNPNVPWEDANVGNSLQKSIPAEGNKTKCIHPSVIFLSDEYA